jgi:hypothetical protein
LGAAKSARLSTASFGGGYGYTGMMIGSFFLNITGLIGLGPQHQDIETQAGRLELWNIASKSSIRTTLGWSAKRTFGGLQLVFDSTNFQLEDEILTINSVLTFVSAGFRFEI